MNRCAAVFAILIFSVASANAAVSQEGTIGVITVESDAQATDQGIVWVQGKSFQVLASDEFQVAMSLTTGDYFEGQFVITNNSGQPFTFDPVSIDAMAWTTSHDGHTKKTGLYTYPANEYVNAVEAEAETRKFFLRLGHALSSAGNHITASTTPGDHAIAESIEDLNDTATQHRVDQKSAQIDDAVTAETDGLLRKHTIAPGHSYAGRVMFGRAKGDYWEFDAKIGTKWFVFVFRSS